MKLINLTPHSIVLQAADGSRTTIPPSGQVARVSSAPGQPETIEGVPVPVYSPQTWGVIAGIPYPERDWEEDTLYVVSLVVLAGIALRFGPCNHPCVAPGTGPNDGAIRYPVGHPQAGQVEAVTRLVRG